MSNNYETLSVRANVNIDANFSEGPIYLSPFPFDLINFCSQSYLLPVQFLLEMFLFYMWGWNWKAVIRKRSNTGFLIYMKTENESITKILKYK